MAFHNVPPNGFPDLPDMEEMEAVVKDVTNLKTSVSDLTEDAEDLASGIAPEFSAESAYTADDIVWHEGALYVFTSDHAAGAWSTDDTQALTVGGEITTLSGNVSDLNSGKANQITIAPFFNPEAEYEAGDLVYYNGLTYRCTNDHQGAWDAADFAATTIANELDTLKSGLTNLINLMYPYNVDKCGAYLNDTGSYITYSAYYVARIPVEEGKSYYVDNPSPSLSTYHRFLNSSDQIVGNTIQSTGTAMTFTAPTNAVALQLTIPVNYGVPKVRVVTN